MSIDVFYRTSSSKNEIINSLIEIQVEKSPVLLWQTVNNKRQMLKIKVTYIDAKNDCIHLTPFDSSDHNSFENLSLGTNLYFCGSNKSIVFKHGGQLSKSHDNYLIVKIPTSVKLYEKRKDKRINFKEVQNIKIVFNQNGISDFDLKKMTGHFLDVSISGAALIMPKKIAHLFAKSDKIKIKQMGRHFFGNALIAEIVYQQNISKENMKNVKFGIKFKGNLDENFLHSVFTPQAQAA